MEQHELDIEVTKDGKVRVHVKGAKGPACMDYVKLLEDLLHTEAEDVERTSEYYEPPTGVEIRVDQKT